MKNRANVWLLAKRLLLVSATLAIGFVLYRFTLQRYMDGGGVISTFLLLWLLTAYYALPRIHRFMTRLYIPDYFIGRVRTEDGLLGDPINLALFGSQKQLINAMELAEWTRADELSLATSLKMIKSSILKHSYPHAPVSSLYLFGRKQDLAYQHEVDGNPHKRHHVRFWKVPPGWKLPGGFEADWLAAGTYDKSVGLSTYTLQITHKIAENIDEERDYIIATLKDVKAIQQLVVVEDYSSGYHDRNGGGDSIKTDGAMPFITLRDVK